MTKTIALLLISHALIAGRSAEPLGPGATVPAIAAKDQHGASYEFKPGTKFLLIAFDMSTGKEANKALENKGADYLGSKQATYISNIHGMPAIGRAFALPKMRKYPHRIILADDEKLLERFPKQKDRITVLILDSTGKIERISFWNPEKEAIDDVLR